MEQSRLLLSRLRPRCRCAAAAGLLLLALPAVARAQRSEGGDFGASDQSLRQGTLAPVGGPPSGPPPTAPGRGGKPAVDLSPGAAARRKEPAAQVPPPGSESDPTHASFLPAPASYMSSAFSFWPHAWAYVPSLWSSVYRDFTLETSPISAAEKPGAESPSAAGPEGLPTGPTALAPAPKLAAEEMQKLPPPTLVRRRRYNLVIGGVGLLAATWAADRLLARDLSTRPETWVPLVGPWFLLAEQSSLAAPNLQNQILLVADGLLQGAGLSMALLGFVLTTKRYQVTIQPARSDLNAPGSQ